MKGFLLPFSAQEEVIASYGAEGEPTTHTVQRHEVSQLTRDGKYIFDIFLLIFFFKPSNTQKHEIKIS